LNLHVITHQAKRKETATGNQQRNEEVD
jgi:hypothetical protein